MERGDRNFDIMCGMSVQDIIDSNEFSMTEKDEFFEEIQLILGEMYDQMEEADENYDYFHNDDYE